MSKEEESRYLHSNASKELEGNKRSSKVLLGSSINEAPKDLYIPPNALEIFLEAFEGPLDLLLYMIKRQNLNILEINVLCGSLELLKREIFEIRYLKILPNPPPIKTKSNCFMKH